MGTEVHCKSYLPGYYSMRDINEDSNSSSWPMFYGDKALTNGYYYNGFMPRTVINAYPGYDKDALKQKMLEHEAIFKNQVYELHRLYSKQRDMMEEVKRKEFHKHRISIETSSSSSFLPSQIPSEDARKWHIPNFPLANPNCARPSLLGADMINSPLSCTKGNSSKDCEVLECRPSKVRKKLFDLQLPADEYIDTEAGEQFQDNQISEISSYPPIENHGAVPKNSVKLFLNGSGGKTNCYGDNLSDACLRGSNRLADLNEPIHVEEASAPVSVGSISAKPGSQFLGLPQEICQKSQNGSNNGTLNKLPLESKVHGRDWLSYMREAGNSKSNMSFASQCLQPDKFPIPSHAMQHMLGKELQTPGTYPNDHIRVDPWRERERPGSSSEVYDRIQDHSNYNQPLPVIASHISNSYPFANSSDMGNSWSHSISPGGKPNSGLTHNLTPGQTYPSYLSPATLSKGPLSSSQNHEVFGEKWHINGSCRSNIGSGSDLPNRNGFYRGSSSRSKELFGFDYLNCNKADNLANGSRKPFKGSDFIDLESTKDMVQNSSNEAVPQRNLVIIDDTGKCEDHQSVLPWLRAKPACKNDVSSDQLLKNGTEKGPCHISNDLVVGAKERGERKILGFPIFGNSCISRNESSSLVSTSASLHCPLEGENVKKEMEHRGIDINVAWDAESFFFEKDVETKNSSLKNVFDLNSCVTEDDDLLLTHSVKSSISNVKITVEIDLEAPVVPEIEDEEAAFQSLEHKAEETKDDEELVRVAAEAIVSFSKSDQNHNVGSTVTSELVSLEDPLLWFVDVVSSCMDNNFERKSGNSYTEELDEFEAMTLQLEETKEEDYMPKTLVPEFREAEETGPTSSLLPNRPRRGQARRGRPRRDFQRDILPGLVSLSRHEVTEDLQIFGGLMRATGHSWNVGLTRSGTRRGARGRRRLVVELPTPPPPPLVEQLSTLEVGLEERSLTGWGKTTRRPRRQRSCHAGNSVSVAVPLT